MKKAILLILAPAIFNTFRYAQRITVSPAGTGTAGYGGDGYGCRNARMNGPMDVCLDPAKNMYLTDHGNGVVRMVTISTGTITTIAGGGTSTADGIYARNATLSPKYMCMGVGELYITTGNQVRAVNLYTGSINTIAGSATDSGYSGDGGAATAALLQQPLGIALDGSGNLYVADHGNHAIRKISTSGVITTIAGSGSWGNSGDGGPATLALLHSPVAVSVNRGGDVYFSDQEWRFPTTSVAATIRKISTSTGTITTIAGQYAGSYISDCPATSCVLGPLSGMCTDTSGNLYFNELSCSCRMLNMANDSVYLVGGDFSTQGFSDGISSPLANMNTPYGIYVDNSGSVFVADSGNQRIRKLVQLQRKPQFAFGPAESIEVAPGNSFSLHNEFTTTDMDSTAVEIWSVVALPTHGTLTGLPASSPSGGVHQVAIPQTAIVYTADPLGGADTFQVGVATGDGGADTLTIYVNNHVLASVRNTAIATSGINIFPNPAHNELHIQSTNEPINEVAITNLPGQNVYNATTHQCDNAMIDVSQLPVGVYLVWVNGSVVRKWVKE